MNERHFIGTPKPRDLTKEEVDRYGLRYYGGERMEPVYEATDNVWAMADNGKLPTYRLYNRGTNDLFIVRYNPKTDEWRSIILAEIQSLYGLIWKLLVTIQMERGETKALQQEFEKWDVEGGR